MNWLDMKRTGASVSRKAKDEATDEIKTYMLEGNDYRYTFPLPADYELMYNNVPQNPGWSKTNVKIYIMRYIIVIFITLLMLSSCEKEKSVILDLNISPDEISRIELRADHKTLVPNGVNKMGFHTFDMLKEM